MDDQNEEINIIHSEYLFLCRGTLPILRSDYNNYIETWCIRRSNDNFNLRLYTSTVPCSPCAVAAIVHHHLNRHFDNRRTYILSGFHGV